MSGILDRQHDAAAGRTFGRDADSLSGRVPGSVLEQVREDLVDEDRVHAHRRQIVRDRDLDHRGREHRCQAFDHRVDQIGQVVQFERRVQRPAFDAAQIEHVAHETAQALRLRVDRAGGGALLVARQLDVRIHEISGGRPNRRQRRAQVVRHRIEQRRLERVSLARDFGCGGLGGEPVTHDRLTELVGGGGEKPSMRPARERIAVDARRPNRADDIAARQDRDAEYGQRLVALAGLLVGGFGGGCMGRFAAVFRARQVGGFMARFAAVLVESTGGGLPHASPARLRLGRARVHDPARSESRSGLPGPAVGHDALLRGGTAQADPDALHLGLARQPVRQQRSRLQGGGRVGGVAAHGEHGASLRSAQLRLAPALELKSAEAADRDGHDQEQQQVEPLLGRRHGERVERRHEEEVVDEERGDGGRDGEPAAVRHADGHDRQQVDDGGIGHFERANDDQGEPRRQHQPDARNRQSPERRAAWSRVGDTDSAQHALMVGRCGRGAASEGAPASRVGGSTPSGSTQGAGQSVSCPTED